MVSRKLSRLDCSSYSILLENTFFMPLGLRLAVDLATSIIDYGKFKMSLGSETESTGECLKKKNTYTQFHFGRLRTPSSTLLG